MPSKNTLLSSLALAAGLLVPAANPLCAADAPLNIGSRRELFVDHFLIGKLSGARLHLHTPRDEGIAFRFDQPWEGPFSGYVTIVRDGGRLLAYYRGKPVADRDGSNNEVTCCAESTDGVRWTRPELALFDAQGAKKNNVVLANASSSTHNFCPFRDERPGVAANGRFKAIGGTMESGLVAWKSADGLRWKKMAAEPVITKATVPFKYMFDSQNVPFWSEAERKYLCYFRVFEKDIRRIVRSESDDFLHWSPPVLMEYRHPSGPAPIEHLYTSQTHPYFRAPHLYVAIAARFMPGRRVLTDEQAKAIKVNPGYFKDTSDAIFMTTRPREGPGFLSYYDRTFMEGFIRGGIGPQNWVSRTGYPALNVVQTGPAEMSVYVNQDYAQPTAHLRRYSLRLDGFASLRADYHGGEMVTKPLTFSGRHLSLNFATSAAGGVKVELQDAGGQPLPGFSLADCQEQIGNELDRVVNWKGRTDLGPLSGKPVRLRFVMKDADVFALQFIP
ncbi:MAG: hypothetical protein WCS99_22325 [Limisphaerales bacterium]